VENVDQKLLILSILQLLREQAAEEDQKRLDIKVISIPETGLVNAAGEEAMIIDAAYAKERIWDLATADISNVTIEELTAAKTLRKKLDELKVLGEAFDNDSAKVGLLGDMQRGTLITPVEAESGATPGVGQCVKLPALPNMVHVACTSLGDLFVSVRQATRRSASCASLIACGQLKAASAIDLSVRHPPMDKVAAEVEMKTLWIPDSEEELEKVKAKFPPSMAARFKPKHEQVRELTAQKNKQYVERMKVEELRLGAASLRFGERKLEGHLPEAIAPSCKSGLRYNPATSQLSEEGSLKLDDIPVVVLELAIDAEIDPHAAYCGVCSAYTPALSPVTHIFAEEPELVRQVLALAGTVAECITVGGIEDMHRLRVGLDQFRGHPYTVGVNIAMVDALLGPELARAATLKELLGNSAP